jgi:hypothetical protein
MTGDRVPKPHPGDLDNLPAQDELETFPQLSADALPAPELVADALRHILESEYFRTSTRGKQFLSYVVQYRLENHPEPLKERMIGAALFNRPLDYATGDDSVVRAQAREVRRRLDKYYMMHAHGIPLRIDLPVGSYTPEFKLDQEHEEETGDPFVPAHLAVRSGTYATPAREIDGVLAPPQRRSRFFLFGALAALVCVGICLLFFYRTPANLSKTAIAQFWGPALSSSKPLLICLPKPIFYRPTADLYKRSAQVPGEFDHEVYRMNHRPHLHPEDKIAWGDMIEFYDYGVGKGDVQAAVRLSNFLGHQGKDSEVRIGNGYTYEDLRNSPAVVIGAFSNPWTIEMSAGLHFSFVDDEKGLRIQEQAPKGRVWFTQHGPQYEDYGLITRLLDSNTGQFVILVAGIEGSGSDAAADLIVNPGGLEKVMKDAPKDWAQKNVQIIVSTMIKENASSPAKVIAVYVW